MEWEGEREREREEIESCQQIEIVSKKAAAAAETSEQLK